MNDQVFVVVMPEQIVNAISIDICIFAIFLLFAWGLSSIHFQKNLGNSFVAFGFRKAEDKQKPDLKPATLPGGFPFLGHALQFTWNRAKLAAFFRYVESTLSSKTTCLVEYQK